MLFTASLIAVLSGISALTLWPMLKPDRRANVTDPQPGATATCPTCRRARDDTDNFCRACGKRLTKERPSVLMSLASAVFSAALTVSMSQRVSVWFRTRGRHKQQRDSVAQYVAEQKAADVYSLTVTALLALLLVASLSPDIPAGGAIAVVVALYRWLEILVFILGLLLAERPVSSGATVFSIGLAGINLILIAAITTVVFLGDSHNWHNGTVPSGALNALYVSATNLVVLGNNSYVPQSDIARVIVTMTAFSGVALITVGLARAISLLPHD